MKMLYFLIVFQYDPFKIHNFSEVPMKPHVILLPEINRISWALCLIILRGFMNTIFYKTINKTHNFSIHNHFCHVRLQSAGSSYFHVNFTK